MESKVPFIAEYDPYSKTRPLKQWRPRSTSPWTISLFLAATGICFGLLLAIGLIEKETTTITKRDIDSSGYNSDQVYERGPLLERQVAATCTAYTTATVTVTVCVPVSGYVCSPAATTEPAATTTDPCAVTIILTETVSYLSLVTQEPEPEPECTDSVTATTVVCQASSGYTCPSVTPVTAPASAATTGSCSSRTLTVTTIDEGYLVLDSPCTSYVTKKVSICSAPSGYYCPSTVTTSSAPAPATTGSCTTLTVYMTITGQGLLSLGTQCTSTVVETVTTCPPLDGFVCPSPTPVAAAAAAAVTGSCSTTTLFSTVVDFGTYYPPASQCTDTVTYVTTVCSPLDGYVCLPTIPTVAAPAAKTGSCITSTLINTVTNLGYLPWTTTSSITPTVTSTDGTSFSLNGQPAPPSTTGPTSTSAISHTISLQTSVGATQFSLNGQPSTPVVETSPTSTTLPYSSPTESSSTTVTLPAPPPTGFSPTTQTSTTSSVQVIVVPITSSSPAKSVSASETSDAFYSSLAQEFSTSSLPNVIVVTDPSFSLTGQTATIPITKLTPVSTAPSTTTQPYFALTDQSLTISISEITYSTTDSEGSLLLTTLPASHFNEIPSQSSTAEFSSTTLAPFINPIAHTTSSSPLAPFVNPTVQTTSTTDSIEASMSPGERTVITTDGATYLLIASTDGIHSSMYTEQVTGSPSNTMSLTTGTNTASTSTPTSFKLDQNFVLIKVHTFFPYYYFLAMYLPKILAVVMTTLWTIIFAGLKLMEPFYQLSANTGAFASKSMFGNYLASHISTSSLSSMFSGQWVLLLAGTVLISWAAIVALVSDSMVVVAQGTCTNLNDPGSKPYYCDPGWAVNEPILNLVMALTGFVFVLTLIILLILMRRKRTGVYHDPSSIAAMAELLGNPLVMEDLQAIKPSSSDREVRLLLGENRYKIGLYDPSTGKDALYSSSQQHDLRWGLIKLDYTSMAQTIDNRRLAGYHAVPNPSIVSTEEQKANRKRRIFQLVYDIVMFLTAMCVFGLVLGYWLDDKSDPLNDFFNSNTFGPRFVLTCLCIVLSVGWRSTSQETTVMAPYRAMAKAYEAQSGVVAGRSILAPIAHTQWTALYKGLRLRYPMVSMVAMCAVLADLLLIAVSGVPYRQSQIRLSLEMSVFTSLSILGIMIVMSVVVTIHNRMSAGGTRKLPRNPNTLMGVWLYLCHGKLVNQDASNLDESTSPLNSDELVAKYEGYQYGFTRNIGMDRVSRWTIDKVFDLRHWSPSMTAHRPPVVKMGQRGPQPVINTEQRGSQPFEASATPVDISFGQTRQDPPVQRAVSRRQPHTSPYGISYFEAQAKSPVAQASPARFEESRPRPQPQAPTRFEEVRPRPRAQAPPAQSEELRPRGQSRPPPSGFEDLRQPTRAQPQPESQPPVVRLTPTPSIPPVRRQEPAPTVHEALAAWEYEQEFHDPRRMSAGSLFGEARWANNGRDQYRRI